MRKLLVIVPDALSVLVRKGEYAPRYYNPGDLFDEVHILATNDDRADLKDLQGTVGRAKLVLHNLPEDRKHFLEHSRLLRPWLLSRWARPLLELLQRYQLHLLDDWAEPAVELARRIQPELIRCHGNDTNAYLAARIKRQLGFPYVVSLHINPDVNPRRRILDPHAGWRDRLFNVLFDPVEVEGLRHADLALPVYEPIVPYLSRCGCTRSEVAYNVLDGEHLRQKDSYELHRPVRIISVGRHFDLKNPENLIRAVAAMPGCHMTLVGDGPYQERLEALVLNLGCSDRIVFRPAVPNAVLCRELPEYDIFAVHTEHWEISKSVLEALLTGLPVILNRRNGEPVPELQGDFVMLVENTPAAYRAGLETLIDDDARRELLGRQGYARAQERWAPEKTEARYVELYRQVMAEVKADGR